MKALAEPSRATGGRANGMLVTGDAGHLEAGRRLRLIRAEHPRSLAMASLRQRR